MTADSLRRHEGDRMKPVFSLNFSEIRMTDVARAGGKNASLGELFAALKPQGVGVLDGFALTTDAYWRLLEEQNLGRELETLFTNFDAENLPAGGTWPCGPNADTPNAVSCWWNRASIRFH